MATDLMGGIDLSIIIVSWNTCCLLDECLQSVQQELADLTGSTKLRAEVFVVDNGSTDGSVEMVRTQYSDVQLIANEHNPGFAGANNQALKRARGRYSLLLNPDTVVLPDGLGALVRFMDDHPGAGAAGSRLLNADRTLQPSCAPAPTLMRELWRMFQLDRIVSYATYDMKLWSQAQARPVDTVQGAAMLVRRAVQEQVGLLDASYFMYSEEVDWCTRIKRAGWEIYWVPSSQIVHYGGQSSKQVADAMFLQLYRGKIQYFHKHWGRFATWIYKLILAVATLARLALSPLALLEPEARRRRHIGLARQYGLLLRALPSM
jgi:N-acetylglucosaminyl-diphospho-decaprenol L-rhamnosyltransferase